MFIGIPCIVLACAQAGAQQAKPQPAFEVTPRYTVQVFIQVFGDDGKPIMGPTVNTLDGMDAVINQTSPTNVLDSFSAHPNVQEDGTVKLSFKLIKKSSIPLEMTVRTKGNGEVMKFTVEMNDVTFRFNLSTTVTPTGAALKPKA